MASSVTPLNTPMLRSQTSSVLVPTWISTLGASGSSIQQQQQPPPPLPVPNTTTSGGGSGTTSPSLSAASNPPPPPPAYAPGTEPSVNGNSPANNNSMSNRSPYFGSVGAGNQGGTRAAALSAGLASWRSAGPPRPSPGTSPSLGPTASSSAGSPPPPPPSYTATVTTVTGTSNQSKKATVFCEIADQVYTRIVNEAAASSAPLPAADGSDSTQQASKEREAAISAAKQSEVGKYLNIIRIAGLGLDGKDKVSSAVTVACQTTLSEPSGRFFVFELAPTNSELWPSHPAELGTPVSENEQQDFNHGNTSNNKGSKKSGNNNNKNNKNSATTTNSSSGISPMESSLSLPPSAINEEIWNKHRLVCIVCPNGSLCTSLKNKLDEVFCASEEEKKRIFIDNIKRPLPVSCCLVIKASNSANRNHEAEMVPWGALMEEGALVPEDYVEINLSKNNDNSGSSSMMPPSMSSNEGGSMPPPESSSPNTAQPSSKPGFPGTDNENSSNNKDDDTNNNNKERSRVPAPFAPSYFRLLRNERGVFRNALFLRFPSQVKAEIAMMYLERINLCGRRIRIEHKKQSRSYAAQQQQQSAGGATSITTTNASSSTSTTSLNNFEIIEQNVNDLIRRYDRDGFSYPKRLLSEKDMKFLDEIADAHDLTFETGGATTVSIIRPRQKSTASNNNSFSAAHHHSKYQAGGRSPALGGQTPPWAPQTPPLHPNAKQGGGASSSNNNDSFSIGSAAMTSSSGNNNNNNTLGNTSFSEKAASGTMTFRGLRHWKEQRQQLAEAEKKSKEEEDGENGGSRRGSIPPSMSLDAGSVTQKYIRCLDWQEAEKRGIAAWPSGRGRPVVTSAASTEKK